MVMALGITFGKIIISLLSAYAIVYFRFRFRLVFFWLIFLTLMLPVEVRIVPTYEVVAGLACSTATGPDPPADRVGDGDLPVPAVLHDHPGRTDGGRARRWRRPIRSSSTSCCRCRAPTSRRFSSSSSSTAGTSISGRLLITTDPLHEHHRHGHQADGEPGDQTCRSGR
jgi:hypothetical protein